MFKIEKLANDSFRAREIRRFMNIYFLWSFQLSEQNIPVTPFFLGALSMMVRKQAGNPADYFDKTFAEYKEGFAANGVLKNNQLIIQIIFKERAGLALTTSTD